MSDASDAVSRAGWWIRQLTKRIWLRASLFSLAAAAVAILAAVIGPYIPYDPQLTLASGSVGNILNILAASMLAVTTFSLSIMTSAYASATSSATPRSTKLLLADPIAQNTLSTFVGTFLFSIVGIIGIASGLYQGKGRVLLFFATIIVLIVVVAALLRWIEQLGRFGRVDDTIRRVEKAAWSALHAHAERPRLGARKPVEIPDGSSAVLADRVGHVQHIDFAGIQECAEDNDVTVHLAVSAGSLLHPARPLAHVAPGADDALTEQIRECFTVGNEREFDQDPRFGIVVLAEIASRALSPAVNDPGTAMEVTGAGLRLLSDYVEARKTPSPRYANIHAAPLDIDDLMSSFFNPIARDGAAIVEVEERLLTVLTVLARQDETLFGKAARREARAIVERTQEAMTLASDRERIQTLARPLVEGC